MEIRESTTEDTKQIMAIFTTAKAYMIAHGNKTQWGDGYRNLPFSMPEVSQPSFPDYEVNIRDFGALSDGVTLNTEAINNAIKAGGVGSFYF